MNFIPIYDYSGACVFFFQVPDKEIDHIAVTVLTGDEAGKIIFSDGSEIHFDASDCRAFNFFDGSYCVKKDDVQKWLAFAPNGAETPAYARMRLFYDEEAAPDEQ